jgi:MoaA/NifB/PqqE/SkfB family radical SAM enzyme
VPDLSGLIPRLRRAARAGTLGRALGLRLRQLAAVARSPSELRAWIESALFNAYTLSIDVVGACNISCPTCPVANWPKSSWTGEKGAMEPEFLDRLLAKALKECVVNSVNLYVYTEPLIHPRIAELVRVVKKRGLVCRLSSNLNLLRDPAGLLESGLDDLTVSVSGFRQENYAVTHAGGDVEAVKRNMSLLADARRRLGAKTRVVVNFHKYRGNLEDLPLMRAFAADCGFEFVARWASLFPLEKFLAHVRPEATAAELTEADREIIGRLALPLREVAEAARRHPVSSCALRESELVLDVRGGVYLCCAAAMDAGRNKHGSFLDAPLESLQKKKSQNPLCAGCMAGGLPPVMIGDPPYLDALAEKALAPAPRV